jgi:4-diphosphocytidyl-2-C-methyl-D-erythritol kinase
MVSFPPCKINLGLRVIGKRSDGYHDLVTCFYPVQWCDILEIIPSDHFSLTVSGLQVPGSGDDNLCVRAYSLLKKDFGLPPVSIHLHKIIPMGAGLGGGSSDAAWTFRLLNRIFNLQLSPGILRQYASQIGSDCAFFVQDLPMLGEGRGEILSEINLKLKGKFLVIVKPDVHISTAAAYAGVKPKHPEGDLKEILEQVPVQQWKYNVKNDFEESVFGKYPVIAEIKETLYKAGALYASMSGSGSAVFGIFQETVAIENVFPNCIYFAAAV